jgi:hypothetical protein
MTPLRLGAIAAEVPAIWPKQLTVFRLLVIIYEIFQVEEKERLHETYLATQAHTAQTRTWLYETYGYPQRAARHQGAPCKGAVELDCVV